MIRKGAAVLRKREAYLESRAKVSRVFHGEVYEYVYQQQDRSHDDGGIEMWGKRAVTS
jgi:hypothetical protein